MVVDLSLPAANDGQLKVGMDAKTRKLGDCGVGPFG